MGQNILIVEDQFIEANNLRLVLEKAEHRICGIAKSVDQALEILEEQQPDIVLLDIYLKGDRTGIDLANIIAKRNLPFIYLSANSNQTTLDEAKATNPYGFLVKPFREKDILAALDIASTRHKQMMEFSRRQETWLSNLLLSIIKEAAPPEQKLLHLAKALEPFIPFDTMVVDVNLRNDGLKSVYSFQRVAYDEYITNSGWDLADSAGLTLKDFGNFRRAGSSQPINLITAGHMTDDSLPQPRVIEKLQKAYQAEAIVWAPVYQDKDGVSSICFFSNQPDGFNCEHADILKPTSPLLADIMKKIKAEQDEQQPIRTLKKGESKGERKKPVINGIIGKSPKLLHVLDQVAQVAPVDTSVLILGETGVGKEGLANGIHQLSGRSLKPIVKINCAAIPGTLIESELFGHERGAFTGATEKRIGKFEQAQGGTIFLDEVGEIPLEVQSKLLRVLQEKEFERIGGRSTIKIDVRIIAATNRNLYKEVAAGRFRLDLYYRLNVFPISLPPLRDRKEDIPLLVNYFLEQKAELSGGVPKRLSAEALQSLATYSWPGNIRELQHIIERHILTSDAMLISQIDIPWEEESVLAENNSSPAAITIADVDKAHIVAALKKANGKVSGKGGAAEILQIPAPTLTSKMKKLGIVWQYFFE